MMIGRNPPGSDRQELRFDVLVLSPTPTAPRDYGHRNRVYQICRRLKERGARIWFLCYPMDMDWRHRLPEDTYRQMAADWDVVQIIPPTRELQRRSAGLDHTIDEWWDPIIGEHVSWLTQRHQFDLFIVSYLYLSKAFEYAPSRVFKILDTIDRLSGRRQLLAAQGIEPEFFYTTEEQEAIGLARADLVWAIKDEEAARFRQITKRPVQTLVHAEAHAPVARRRGRADEDVLVLGCLGAHNNVNLVNYARFFETAIPAFRKTLAPVRLRVAGSMCDALPSLDDPMVEWVGRVESVDAFYETVDAVVVPMAFGTGLKTKVVEALSRDVPVIAHVHAFEGLPTEHPAHALPTVEAVRDACIELAFDQTRLDALRAAGQRVHRRIVASAEASITRSLAAASRHRRLICFVLSDPALSAASLAFSRLRDLVEYLKWLDDIVLYVAADLGPAGVKGVEALHEISNARVILRPGTRLPAEAVERLTAKGIAVETLALDRLLAIRNVTSAFIDGGIDPYTLSALRRAECPIFLSADVAPLKEGSPLAAGGRAAGTCLLSSRSQRLGTWQRQLGASTGACVANLFSLPVALHSSWRVGEVAERRVVALCRSDRLWLAAAVAEEIGRVWQTGGTITVVTDDLDKGYGSWPADRSRLARLYGVRAELTSEAEVERDIARFGPRPGWGIDLEPGADGGALLRDLLDLAGVPMIRLERSSRHALPRASARRWLAAWSTAELLAHVQRLASNPEYVAVENERRRKAVEVARHNDGTRAAVWRLASEARSRRRPNAAALADALLGPDTVSKPHPDQLFCSKPFKWFEVAVDDVYACCPGWLRTPIGRLDEHSVAEVWNSDTAQRIRRSILDGSFAYCDGQRCPYLQTMSGPVQRVRDVTDPDLLAVIRDGLTILPYGPRQVTCSYDRSCNLSCPSCRSELIMEHDRKDAILGIQKKLNDEALAQAEMLLITGSGDPFGSPYFRRWLQTMRRSDMPRLKKLDLHSNGLLWTPHMWQTIPADMRELITSADISIDAATPETYAINRRGGDLSRLLKNLEFIGSLRLNGPLEWFAINMVVQENNFEEMAAFVELGRRFHCDVVYFHQLANWGTFSEEEFARRAVHLPGHPRHEAFRRVLGQAIFDDPLVFLGNLQDLRRSPEPREPPTGAASPAPSARPGRPPSLSDKPWNAGDAELPAEIL